MLAVNDVADKQKRNNKKPATDVEGEAPEAAEAADAAVAPEETEEESVSSSDKVPNYSKVCMSSFFIFIIVLT